MAVVLAAGRACEQWLPGAIIEWIMHLQQAKVGKSGGLQYWLQDAPEYMIVRQVRFALPTIPNILARLKLKNEQVGSSIR